MQLLEGSNDSSSALYLGCFAPTFYLCDMASVIDKAPSLELVNQHPKHITLQRYFQDLDVLCNNVKSMHVDCIVCMKRSGMFPGAYMSFQLNLPLFTTSELNSIPEKFTNVLLLDDKTYSGKSMRHWLIKLIQMEKKITTAAVYLQNEYKTDLFAVDLGCQHTMFYEL